MLGYVFGIFYKEVVYLVVKQSYIFFVLTTVRLSDSVLLVIFESLSCLSDKIKIEVCGCSIMVSSQLINDLDTTINLKIINLCLFKKNQGIPIFWVINTPRSCALVKHPLSPTRLNSMDLDMISKLIKNYNKILLLGGCEWF